MATTIARTPTRTVSVLIDLSPGRHACATQNAATLSDNGNRADGSTTRAPCVTLLGRVPRVALASRHREDSTSRAASPQVLAASKKTRTAFDRLRKG